MSSGAPTAIFLRAGSWPSTGPINKVWSAEFSTWMKHPTWRPRRGRMSFDQPASLSTGSRTETARMTETNVSESEKARGRQIGTIGTVARVLIGSFMVLYGLTGGRIEVMHSNVQTGFDPLSVGVGVVAFPALLLAWQWVRARTAKGRYDATAPLATTINIAVFIALALTRLYSPPLSFTSTAECG